MPRFPTLFPGMPAIRCVLMGDALDLVSLPNIQNEGYPAERDSFSTGVATRTGTRSLLLLMSSFSYGVRAP